MLRERKAFRRKLGERSRLTGTSQPSQVKETIAMAQHPALNRLCSLILLGGVTLSLLFQGSVNPLPFDMVAILLCANAVLAAALQGVPQRAGWVFSAAVALLAILCGWSLLQTLNLPAWLDGNSAWRDANEMSGALRNSISIRPADTAFAIPKLGLPFVVFITALVLSNSDERATGIIRGIGFIGGAIAILALIQFMFFPNMLLLEQKQYYLTSLTAVFTNRNTAATFLGLSLLIWLTQSSQRLEATLQNHSPQRAHSTADIWAVLLYALLVAWIFTALILTKSRAGTTSSVVAAFYLVAHLALFGGIPGMAKSSPTTLLSRPLARIVALAAFMMLVILTFGGSILLRIQLQGLEDGRFCIFPGLVAALSDHWITGTGFGTFSAIFPAYRDAACGTSGIWDRAHDTYIEAYLGLGLISVPVLLVCFACLIRILITGLRQRYSMRRYAILGIASMILVSLHAILDFSLQIPGFALYFSTLMGAISAICVAKGGRIKRPTAENFQQAEAERLVG